MTNNEQKKSRTQMRVAVFESVYQLLMETNGEIELEAGFEKSTFDGITKHLEKLKTIVSDTALDFKQDRLFKVDFAILILATYELMFCLDTPYEVVVDQAIELAKKYSTDNSPKFVNGVLAKILKQNTSRLN